MRTIILPGSVLLALVPPAFAQISESEIDALVKEGTAKVDAVDIEALVLGAKRSREEVMSEAREALDNSVRVEDAVKGEYGFDLSVKTEGVAGGDGRLYIFVTLSMPDDLIRQYLDQALKYGGRVVIRGFYKGSFAETSQRLAGLVDEDETRRIGVQIDPRAFETFDVKAAPAIALAEKPLERCETEECVLDVGKFDIIYGAVSVQYALERFAGSGEVRTVAVDNLGYKR